jgi:hypothetical protein
MVVTGITDAQFDGSDESDESDELDADDVAEAVLGFDCASSLSLICKGMPDGRVLVKGSIPPIKQLQC